MGVGDQIVDADRALRGGVDAALWRQGGCTLGVRSQCAFGFVVDRCGDHRPDHHLAGGRSAQAAPPLGLQLVAQ